MAPAGHRGKGSGALFLAQRNEALDLHSEDRRTCLKQRLNHTPDFTKPEQLPKNLLRCHRPTSSCRPKPSDSTGNDKRTLKQEILKSELHFTNHKTLMPTVCHNTQAISLVPKPLTKRNPLADYSFKTRNACGIGGIPLNPL